MMTADLALLGITKGEYTVRCSFVGYQSKTIPVLIGETNNIFDLGKIELEQVTELLDEVIIQATEEMIAAELDKKTFSMDDQFAQSGGSVLDAMKVLPGVTVDQDGKVLLRGSDKVAILIDGKQSSLTGFGNSEGTGQHSGDKHKKHRDHHQSVGKIRCCRYGGHHKYHL